MRSLLALALLLTTPALADESSLGDELSKAELIALENALDEANHAVAVYAKAQLDFEDAKTFASVLQAHREHADVLAGLLVKHGEAVPANRWAGRVHSAPSLVDACRAGLEAEQASAQRQAEFLASTDRADLRAAYSAWQADATEYVDAFAKCVEKAEKKARK
ncbi:MAG: hypothetical protein EP330_16265 [Deltaproteobacteria bacterium]|nr:MAG: hypothetical protein EP330_16265 [Deltaproteobacteria bacterium]